MKFNSSIRHIVVAASPFLIGFMLGFLIMPADGKALQRTDFAGISQMGDPDCARLARQAGIAFVNTAFKVYDVRAGKSRYCDLSASQQPQAALAPKVTFGLARSRFATEEFDRAR
jgi:hypothetical protein